jgi:hypothetical protein
MLEVNYSEIYKTNPDLVRTLVKSALNDGLVQVCFKKVNGEFRDMLCTTNKSFLIEDTESKIPKQIRKENLDVCRVFDVQKKEWRSFRYENIISLNLNEKV